MAQQQKEFIAGQFPGCIVVRILDFHCNGPGWLSGEGTEIPQAQPKRKKIMVTI